MFTLLRSFAAGLFADFFPFGLGSGFVLVDHLPLPHLGGKIHFDLLAFWSCSTTSAIAKLSKASTTAGPSSKQLSEKKETPQERLKRIMSKQLNKQIKKDTVVELTKRREQERQRQEKLAETSRIAKYRHHSQSRSRSRSRSPVRKRFMFCQKY
eukprot:Gb_10093 [translate_table: standard]